jgi:5-amino-6-(5-phospho-D-ribitylamino)uracil phosphatase
MVHYRLIALDMDGTVLNDRQEISKPNIEWIRKAQAAGIIVCFATGRGFQSALPYAEQLGLMDAPMVNVNGSEIWHSPHHLHKRTLMDPAVIERLHKLALESDVWFWAYAVDGIYNRERWIGADLAYDAKQWLKFGYYSENPPLLADIRRTVESWGILEMTNSSPANIELNPLGISKASGLREVCSLLGIDMSQVVAMGDSLNDMTMIREAGLGVAMGNAQDVVKAEADYVTDSNEDHGVARAIREMVLKG